MEILVQPDSLSLVGSMNAFEIAATRDVVFILRDAASDKIIVQHTYTPNENGRIALQAKDIILPLLSFKVSDSSEPYEQTEILKKYEAAFSEVGDDAQKKVEFSVVRAGVDKLEDSASNFLKTNFLTWQPNVKGVTYYSPEFLTYYAGEDCVAKCKMYFWNGLGYEEKEVALAVLNAGKVWTIPVQYAIIAKNSSNDDLPSYYDVWVEGTDGTRFTYVQRYYADGMKGEEEEWFLFENSLGGIDCFRAYGNSENTAEHTHNVAEIEEDSEEYRVDTARKFKKNTGYLDDRERKWLLDFFPSLGKYRYYGQSLRKITVTESDVNYEAKELPSNYSFTYKFSDARPYLNLRRTDVQLSEMSIHVPDIGNFTIAPRLVEFPRITLSGGALFPVQNPYSEEWGTTTLDAMYAHLVAQLAEGYKGGGGVGHTHGNFDLLSALTEFNAYVLLHGEKLKAGFADIADDFSENGEASGKILRKDREDAASKTISFYEGLLVGVLKKWGITKEGLAKLSKLSIEGDSQLGDNGTSSSFGSFVPETAGARIEVSEDGTSTAEFDYINIRRAAQFREITIKELRHIGGELAISAAAMVCSKVERLDASGNVIVDGEAKAFRCYFDTSAGDGAAQKVFQQFKVGDQARCQQFGLDGTTEEAAKCTRYYWRLVTEVGADYIVLSDVDKDPLSTVEPQAGDNIVQLGYRYEGDTSRQSATILSATSGDAPSTKCYQGINDYSLNHLVKDEGYENGAFHSNVYGNSYTGDKDGNSYFSYDAVKKTATFKGRAVFTHGTELPDGTAIEDVTTKKDLENFNIRSGNLLRNTAFSGDYESRDVSGDMDVSEETETFSAKLKYWSTDGHTAISVDGSSMSGKAATIGSLSQRLDKPLLDGEPYTLSFVGKGGLLAITIGETLVMKQQLTAESKRYELHFVNEGASDVVFFASDNATISDIMLSYGTIAPAWSPAYVDNDKSMAQFQSVKYLLDAIAEGSTTIDGGVVMSQMLKVGNFRDRQMVQETGGMSGYYNDDNSPYLWGGGSYEQAIHTVQKYKDNPNYQPSEEELKNMANFVVTHGGRAILNDIILRGIIYAEGGVMKSIKSPNGNFEIDEEGNAKLKGHIEAGDGKVGGFSINQDSLYYGNPSKWATTKTENLAQVGWNFIRIAQAIANGGNPIAYQKIGIGGNAYPGDEEDSSVVGSTAMYIYRSMLAYSEDKAYKPAAIIESDNAQNRNIALRLIGGLQVHGGVIQHGCVMTYEKKGDANALNLSFGTIFTLRNAMKDSMDFFFPSLPEVRQQIGIGSADVEFCIPVTVIAAANTTQFAISTQLAAANTDLTQADGGRYVENNGIWDYGNDKGYGGNRIVMMNGDCWSFSLTFTKAQGYYIQILNKQV